MRALLLTAIFVSSVNAQTNTITFQSPVTQTALLELYTSEGCSSCPPAEAQLSRWKTSSGLWKNFVPIAFHVDYWDYLGWRDPWATTQFSDRQRTYAQQWPSSAIYTPAFVLNGREFRNWARKGIPTSSDTPIGLLTANSVDLSHWQINFVPTNSSTGEYEAHAAILASGLTSDVKAGENRGRRLSHDFVALTLTSGRLVRHGDSVQGEVQFQSLPQSAGKLALAVWITKSDRLEPLQATGGWLH